MVGYDRYEDTKAARCMQTLYDNVRPYVNCFQPLMKMTAKKRIGSRLRKWYDSAKTPFQRVLAVCEASADSKAQLQQQYLSLNPVALLRRIHQLQDELWHLAKG